MKDINITLALLINAMAILVLAAAIATNEAAAPVAAPDPMLTERTSP